MNLINDRALFIEAKALLDLGITNELKAIGIDEKAQELLRGISMESIMNTDWTETFKLVLDSEAMQRSIDKTEQIRQRNVAIDRLIQARGSNQMCVDLFGVALPYVKARRKHFGLCINGKPVKPKSVPRSKMVDFMVEHYKRLRDSNNEAAARSAAFIVVADELDVCIRRLYSEIQAAIELHEFCWFRAIGEVNPARD